MLSLPEKYNKQKKFSIAMFLNDNLTSKEKQRFKDSVNEIILSYQMDDYDIPNLINDEYNCQVIYFLEVAVKSIKDSAFVSEILQRQIKPLCVIRFYDSTKECYSFAAKRLNRQDNTQIVVEDIILTEISSSSFDDGQKTLLKLYIDFETILNKNNKLSFYMEMLVKAFILTNMKLFSGMQVLLDGKLWYNIDSIRQCFELLKELKNIKILQAKTAKMSEKAKMNGQIKMIIKQLEDLK